jgi:hypothetical protein
MAAQPHEQLASNKPSTLMRTHGTYARRALPLALVRRYRSSATLLYFANNISPIPHASSTGCTINDPLLDKLENIRGL